MVNEAQIEASMMAILRARGPQKTCCPSEVARACYPAETQWRAAMPVVRKLATDHPQVRILQGGREVNSAPIKGPIRLQLRPSPDDL